MNLILSNMIRRGVVTSIEKSLEDAIRPNLTSQENLSSGVRIRKATHQCFSHIMALRYLVVNDYLRIIVLFKPRKVA